MSSHEDKLFTKYRDGYSRLWKECEVWPSKRKTVEATANRILASKVRYKAIEVATGVPWWVVGIVHKMEGNCSFEKHLHNGDSLKGRTWQVPKGRPKTGVPPFTWEESAIDAIRYDGLDKIEGDMWTLERVAFAFEKFNGFGYYKYGINSPYLWSFTNNYSRGKYVRDGVYDANAVSQQSGAMAILKVLMEKDRAVVVNATDSAPVRVDEDKRLPAAENQKLRNSRTLYGLFAAGATYIVTKVGELFGFVGDNAAEVVKLASDVATESGSFMAPLTEILGYIGVSLPWIGAAAVLYGILIAAYARYDAHRTNKVG